MRAISAALNLLPGWVWALIVLGLAAANFATSSRLSAERLAHQITKADHATAITAAQSERAAEESRRRQIEQELNDAQETHAKEVATISADLVAARAAARNDSARVQNNARAFAKRVSEQCAASTSAAVRETAASALDVLADLFSRAESRATELAGIADERGIAGQACERLYDEARLKLAE